MKVTVIGAGAWGTALARLLAQNGQDTCLWGHDEVQLRETEKTRINQKRLPGIELPGGLRYAGDLSEALNKSQAAVMAIPSKAFRAIAEKVRSFDGIVVSVTKGIEHESGLTMSGILEEVLSNAKVAALSGPTLAMEVAMDRPTAAVAASKEESVAHCVQELFHRRNFRVYTSLDILGVELGGALKNIIAIGAGVCDGMDFGDNSRAALITRGIVEIQRLGVACGAHAETFAGLSGLGDLVVTCMSRLSRNRGLGERLARGEKLEEIMTSKAAVAEGVPTARSAYRLARKFSVSTPIIDEVYAMLYEGKELKKAIHDLITRETKPEMGGG